MSTNKGKIFQDWLNQKGLKVATVAKKIKVSRQYLYKIFDGAEMSTESQKLLKDEFGYTYDGSNPQPSIPTDTKENTSKKLNDNENDNINLNPSINQEGNDMNIDLMMLLKQAQGNVDNLIANERKLIEGQLDLIEVIKAMNPSREERNKSRKSSAA